jgi:hypothetical protein
VLLTTARMQSQAWGVAGIGFIIIGLAYFLKSRKDEHRHTTEAVHHAPPQHAVEVAHRVADKK